MQIINDGNECPGCTLAKMLINLVLSQVLALVSATAQEMAYEGDLLEALKIKSNLYHSLAATCAEWAQGTDARIKQEEMAPPETPQRH